MTLRKLRLEKFAETPSLGVKELSELLDISTSQYYKLEQNPLRISGYRLKKLSELFDVTIDDIIKD